MIELKSTDYLEKTVGRNMTINGASGEILEVRNILLKTRGKVILVIKG